MSRTLVIADRIAFLRRRTAADTENGFTLTPQGVLEVYTQSKERVVFEYELNPNPRKFLSVPGEGEIARGLVVGQDVMIWTDPKILHLEVTQLLERKLPSGTPCSNRIRILRQTHPNPEMAKKLKSDNLNMEIKDFPNLKATPWGAKQNLTHIDEVWYLWRL